MFEIQHSIALLTCCLFKQLRVLILVIVDGECYNSVMRLKGCRSNPKKKKKIAASVCKTPSYSTLEGSFSLQ
jgi:hypothetical protein